MDNMSKNHEAYGVAEMVRKGGKEREKGERKEDEAALKLTSERRNF